MGLEIVVLIIYGLALLFIFLYSIVQIQLVYFYLKSRNKSEQLTDNTNLEEGKTNSLPFVTVQLPVFNEKYVIERLILNAAAFNYPIDRFEIQVLDDSTDETSEIVSILSKKLKEKSIDIHHIQRDSRDGFKAGALAEGLKSAKGEFIAVFDADFVPHADFLIKTVHYFNDEELGMVQTKWEHVNEKYSWLTRLQAFGLDAHFSVEQGGRNFGGHFINFNGTAGIWRKSCIENAGGWSADTLTEDLDLSYRAQMKGWKFKYLENVGSPAELPAEMNALKTQQYRWTKGAAECSRKNLFKLLKSRDFNLQTKLNGVFHLLNSSLFICIIVLSILSIPVLFIKHHFIQYESLFKLASVFFIGILFLAIFYFTSLRYRTEGLTKTIASFIWKFPLFLSVSMGLSLHNGLAAIEGLIGKKTAFIRTPKFNIVRQSDDWKSNIYATRKMNKMVYLEILLLVYFVFGLFLSFKLNDFGLMPFLIMLVFGYSFVSFLSIKQVYR